MSQAICPDDGTWRAFLTEGSGKADELARHLETCAGCQRTLEVLAAEPAVWEDAQGLGDAARGEAALRQVIEQLKSEDLPAEDEDLSFLRATDNPGLLGLLGRYEVQEEIGRGGMGIVLKALDPDLKRVVAIKVLSPWLASSATARRRFVREGQAAAAVCHDHVITVHGVHESEGLPYLVMQYVAGESLQARLDRSGPPAVDEVVRIGMQTAAGLAAAHAQGLIHRDIKPANLLLENGLAKVKITDFGLARTVDDVGLTQSGVVAGTPEYMAPEQARGEAVDHRADLFSLGSVLYAMCTGVSPFRAVSAVAVLRRVSDEKPRAVRELNPNVPAWLEALIGRLMAKDPAQRFASAAEVAALLEGYLAHLRQPATAPAPDLPSPAADGSPRRAVLRRLAHHLWLPALVLSAAAGLGIAIWMAAGAGEADPRAGGTGAAAAPPELKARFHQDLRSADLTDSQLRTIGEGVRLEAAGVRVTLPGGQGVPPAAGLCTNVEVHGDFEITGAFEVLKVDRPTTGYGAGVALYAAVDPNTNDAVSLAHRLLPDGKTVFMSNRMTPAGGRLQHKVKTLPATAAAGKLRLRRVGSKVRFLVADGAEAGFVPVDEVEFNTADVCFVQFGGNTGGSATGLDVRLLELTLRGEKLAGVAEPVPEVPAASAPPPGRRGWWAAGLLIGLAATLCAGLGVWLYARQNRRAAARRPAPDGGTIPFSCPDCSRRLKVMPEQAGKRVKCPGCGKALVVPDGGLGESAQKR